MPITAEMIRYAIEASRPAATATIIQIFAVFAAFFASSIFPAVTALLILAENTIATIPNGIQQQRVDMIDSTRYGTQFTVSP